MAAADDQYEQFSRLWQSPRGFPGWLSVVNNQPLGVRFLVTSFSFFLAGGVLALLLRIQLAVSENTFLSPEAYNQIFTMHGSTMMFLFAVPFLEGLAVYLTPLMIGSRDLAFPRLTAFGFWCYLFGGLMFYVSFLTGHVPDAGWFAYPPLSGPKYAGLGMDFWALALGLVEIAGITAGVEIIVTILKFRAPGMSLGRMPLYIWAMLVTGVMILFAFTTLLVATLLLELDRTAGTQFFNPDRGGSSLLWQHLFWFFGHPEVYIIFIPATGIVSMVVSAFSRRLLGYTLITVAILLTAFLSFGLWVHHMYTTGLPELSLNFFAAASLMIAVASGTQVFAWIATLWGRGPALHVPLMYILGFVFNFVLGGMTGVMVAIVPFDWQVHDSYFVVAHFHYVLIGGAVFPMMAGLYYWIPKITGRMLNRSLGLWGFWTTFIGFNVTFFPMHLMGFFGLPRRVYTYPASLELDGYNFAATLGSFILALGFGLFVWDLVLSLRRGPATGKNPWGGDSLEWSVESPPPIYAFLAPPLVDSRHPEWTASAPRNEDDPARRAARALWAAPAEWRATLVTDAVLARPQAIHYLPGPSYQPLFAAVGLLVASIGVLTKFYLIGVAGLVFAAGSLLAWLWPDRREMQAIRSSDVGERAGLPIGGLGARSVGWCGMVCTLAVLGTVLGTLAYSYFYLRLYSAAWPQDNLPRPALAWPLSSYALLAISGGSFYWAMRHFWHGQERHVHLGLAGTWLLGVAFLGLQIYVASRQPFRLRTNAYASIFQTTSAFVGLLVLVGLALLLAAQIGVWRGRNDRVPLVGTQMQITALYWYFCVVAGVLVCLMLYVSPYVL